MKTIHGIAFLLACWTFGGAWPCVGAPDSNAPKFFRSDFGLPAVGPSSLPTQLDAPENLRWRQPTDPGHSTPILWNNRMFFTTYRADGQELATVALDRDNGKLLWRRVAPARNIEAYHAATGSPAAPTPACDGQRLYVFFGSCGLLCYDLDGKLLWEHPLGPFQDEFGSGSSPILAGNKLIVCRDQDTGSFLMAIDPASGKTLWKTPRPDAVRSYSTPVVWRADGQSQLLVAGALELAAYDLDQGERLWWVNGLARIVVPMPAVGGDTIYMASWSPGGDAGTRQTREPWAEALAKWDRNRDGKIALKEIPAGDNLLLLFYRMDLDQDNALSQAEWEKHAAIFQLAENAVLAIRPKGRGDLTEKAVVWKYQRGVPYVSTPLLHDGVLWMVKDGGIVTKLDAATGELLHQERLPGLGSYYASPVIGDGKVWFASEQGVVSIVAATREWRVVASRDFGEKIYATPVLEGNRIYLRTEKAVYCFGSVNAVR